jgi:hypothetical protein
MADLQQARELLREAMALAPRCFHCKNLAVYSYPTAVLGDRLLGCEEHKGAKTNDFGDERFLLPQYRLYQKIEAFLKESG